MKRPLIGLNSNFQAGKKGKEPRYWLDRRYVDAVRRAGGVPTLLPLFRKPAEAADFLGRLNAIVFTGGGDILPKHWGERRRHPRLKLLHPEREKSDLLLARAALRSRIPILAICNGIQLVNVALGGSLHQHIGDLPGILRAHLRNGTCHKIRIEPGSLLREVMGRAEPEVNSFHHQAVRRCGRGLFATSTASDGVIESVQHRDGRFLLAVQWHPERIIDRREHFRLFQALVSEAKKR